LRVTAPGLTLNFMKRYLALVWLLVCSSSFAQDPAAHAAALAARQEQAEERRLMMRDIEDLRQSVVQQQRRINELINENNALQRQITEMDQRNRAAQANGVTRKDLEKIIEALKEVDSKRVADNNVIKEQIKKVAEIAAKPPQVIVQAPPTIAVPPPTKTPKDEPDKTDKSGDDEPPPNPRGYFTYKIQSKDTLMGIINAYNAKFKEQGKATVTLEQVKKANPKLNPNRMIVGKEVLIPIPPDK
jgi:TolA-binding protein